MAAAAVLVAVLGAGGDARAFLETGSLLTMSVSATYMGGGQGTSITYSATAKILVANPSIFAWKDVTPTVISATGGYVTCILSFSNGGANTAFNVTLNDKLPNGTGCWFQNVVSAWSGSGTPAASWSADNTTWTGSPPPAGQSSPSSVYLRWIVPSLGIGVSGVITFVVSFG
jgi:uncharacterized repeat protein (TIGR01451 family)